MKTFATVDAYIKSFPKDTQALLVELRTIIKHAAPSAIEGISYGMPAYKQNGPLVYFGGAAKHIGFYPTAKGIEAFAQELTKYKTSKGAVRFPLDTPLPKALITRMVKQRIKDNL